MKKIIIRNDDVSVDLPLEPFVDFCSICDKYKVEIIQCITPLGKTIPIRSEWDNDLIKKVAGDTPLTTNKELYEYLLSRNDLIAVHGLQHTHKPTVDDIYRSKQMLEGWKLKPTYNVYPFNESTVDYDVWGLKSIYKVDRLEDYLVSGIPKTSIVYLHSWRFFPQTEWYTLQSLDRALWRITNISQK